MVGKDIKEERELNYGNNFIKSTPICLKLWFI